MNRIGRGSAAAPGDHPVDITVTFLRGSVKAVLIEQFDGEQAWLPRSQVEQLATGDDPIPGDEIEITVPRWLAEEKGLAG